MKANRIFVLALVVGLIFAFSDTVLGDGTDPRPDKSNAEIDARLLITGSFTARKFKQGNDYECEVIAKLKLIHSNGFETTGEVTLKLIQPISGTPIYLYTVEQLKETFKKKIGAADILPKGIAGSKLTLTDLNIISIENRDNFDHATIHGWVAIRVEP